MAEVERAYEKAMVAEVKAICRGIADKDLCIQWDVCNEMILWDGQETQVVPRHGLTNADLLASLKRICSPVPKNVELGIHLCYGDFDGKHYIEPRDGARMAEFANAISKTVKHKLAFIHMPVPVGRTDEAFFRPLSELKLRRGTELYLGLIHAEDDAAGTKKRIEHYVPFFGIACECGMTRGRTPAMVVKLPHVHAAVSRSRA